MGSCDLWSAGVRCRYSKDIVYNNYPWPEATIARLRQPIEAAAKAVLDIRASFKGQSLADLYDPDAMPPELHKAHEQLDKAVDFAYGYKGRLDDVARVSYLFGVYLKLTAATAPAKSRAKARRPANAPF